MPFPLNNVATQDQYTDALTCVFPLARPGFALNVNNASVFYTLAYAFPGDREPTWTAHEHTITPSFSTFRDVTHEGLPPGSLFAGVMLRSALPGTPAQVTVM